VLHYLQPYNLYTEYDYHDHFKDSEMYRTYSTHLKAELCVKGSHWMGRIKDTSLTSKK
jgi:hypothetical protein